MPNNLASGSPEKLSTFDSMICTLGLIMRITHTLRHVTRAKHFFPAENPIGYCFCMNVDSNKAPSLVRDFFEKLLSQIKYTLSALMRNPVSG